MADPAALRRYERIDIALRCRLFIPDLTDGREPREGRETKKAAPPRLRFEAFAVSKNLCLGGLFVQSAFLLKQNVQVSVELHLPNGPLPIRSRIAHVVGPEQTDHTTGMGIEFLDVDNHGRETLLRYFTPATYGDFYQAMLGEFPHLRDEFALEDVSLLVNLWEEAKAKGTAKGPSTTPVDRRKPGRR